MGKDLPIIILDRDEKDANWLHEFRKKRKKKYPKTVKKRVFNTEPNTNNLKSDDLNKT